MDSVKGGALNEVISILKRTEPACEDKLVYFLMTV